MCKKNDRASQNDLFDHFAPFVLSIARRYCDNENDAKDIFLRGFEKLFRNLDHFNPAKGNFKQWISRITINTALTHIKQNQKYVFFDDPTVFDQSIEPSILEDLSADYLHELINELSDPKRLIFNMTLDGYSHVEIANILNINTATCRSYFFRAKKELKIKLTTSLSDVS